MTQRKNGRLFAGYRFYNFVKKDPVIDKLRTLLQDEGFYNKKARKRLSLLTGVSVSTYDNMFEGDTRMPRHTTVGGTVAALGFKEVFVRDREAKIDREREIAKAAKELAGKREALRKQKARTGGR
jgi:hypothetical protein